MYNCPYFRLSSALGCSAYVLWYTCSHIRTTEGPLPGNYANVAPKLANASDIIIISNKLFKIFTYTSVSGY